MNHEDQRNLLHLAVIIGALLLIAKCLSDKELGAAMTVAVFAGAFLWTSKAK